MITLRRNKDSIHGKSVILRLARRVAQSPITAKLLAAADSVDKLAHFNKVLPEAGLFQACKLILDSRTMFYLCSPILEPKQAKPKFILDTFWKEYKHIDHVSLPMDTQTEPLCRRVNRKGTNPSSWTKWRTCNPRTHIPAWVISYLV